MPSRPTSYRLVIKRIVGRVESDAEDLRVVEAGRGQQAFRAMDDERGAGRLDRAGAGADAGDAEVARRLRGRRPRA